MIKITEMSLTTRQRFVPARLAMAACQQVRQVFELLSVTTLKLFRPGVFLVAIGVSAMCQAPLLAQSAAVPSFDVASVKLVTDPQLPAFLPERNRCSGGPGTKTPGKFECKEVSLKSILARAYNVPARRISGPDWLETERYNIAAKLDPETRPENFRLMLQNLLTERFSLRFHRKTRSTAVYLLTVAKNGPKLQPVRKAPEYKDAADRKAALQASLPKNMEKMEIHHLGGSVNSALISGLNAPQGIAIVATVPEPSSLTLTLFGLVAAGLVFRPWRKRTS